MASLKFYLDKPGKASELCALYLRYKSLAGNTTFYPNVSVAAARWDGKAQRVRGTSLEAKKINQELITFKQDVEGCIGQLREHSGLLTAPDPAPALLKELVLRTVSGVKVRQRSEAAGARVAQLGLTTTPTTERAAADAPAIHTPPAGPATTLPELVLQIGQLRRSELRAGSIQQYQYTCNCLLRFCAADDPRWLLRSLTPRFLAEWRTWLVSPTKPGFDKHDTRYLQGKLSKQTGTHQLVPGGLGVDNQTANNRLATVAAVLNYARRADPVYRRLLSEELVEVCQRKFKKLVQPRTHLNAAELLQVYHAPLPPEATASEHLLRDLYCLSWFTALRQSDMLLLGPQHLVWAGEPHRSELLGLDITSLKSGVAAEVPLNTLATGIIHRWLNRDARLAESAGESQRRSLARFRWPADRLFPQLSKNRFEIIKRLFEHLNLFHEPVEIISSRGAEQIRQTVPRWQLLTLHTARHGFGNFMAEQNVPIEDAQLLMGHDDLDSTRIYYHRPHKNAVGRARTVMSQFDPPTNLPAGGLAESDKPKSMAAKAINSSDGAALSG